jgi:putative SOS response-associated peptidase YedK
MCYFSSISVGFKIIEDRFGVKFIQTESFVPLYSVSAFTFPALPVISCENPDQIVFMKWGLIPFWIKDQAAASAIREKTLNAREDTIFEKPAFRQAIKSKRCLIVADGFFEWRHLGSKTFPYYIRLKTHEPFAFAGIWDNWIDPETRQSVRTFSLITTRANSLLEQVHNTQKRMPVILSLENEKLWVRKDLDQNTIRPMMAPYRSELMEAYPVSRIVNKLGYNTSDQSVVLKQEYPGLPGLN